MGKAEVREIFDAMVGLTVGSYLLTTLEGVGTYGAVFCAEHEKTERLYAVKCLLKGGLTDRQLELQRLEITFNQMLKSHPNICSLVETLDTEEHLYMIFEYCESGDLYELIKKGKVTRPKAKAIFLQLLAAIEHCHTHSVFHRDLKPENALLTVDTVKICDFGLASNMPYPTDFEVGSRPYMAPELFDRSLPSYSAAKADLWALGVIFFNLLFQVNPWEKASPEDPHFAEHLRDPACSLTRRFDLSEDLSRLFREVFEVDPKLRCPIKQLRSLVLALDFPAPPPAAKSSSSSLSSSLSSSPLAGASGTTPASAGRSAATAATAAPTHPLTAAALSSLSSHHQQQHSSRSMLSSSLSPASSSASSSSSPSLKAGPTPIPSSSSAALSSSLASDASFKSAMSSFRASSAKPMAIHASDRGTKSAASSFGSSFASSWADDDLEMDFDDIPDFSSPASPFPQELREEEEEEGRQEQEPLSPAELFAPGRQASQATSSGLSSTSLSSSFGQRGGAPTALPKNPPAPSPLPSAQAARGAKKHSPVGSFSSASSFSPKPSPGHRSGGGSSLPRQQQQQQGLSSSSAHPRSSKQEQRRLRQETSSESDEEAFHDAQEAHDGVFHFDPEEWQGNLSKVSGSGGHHILSSRSSTANPPPAAKPPPPTQFPSKRKSGSGFHGNGFSSAASSSSSSSAPSRHAGPSSVPSSSSASSSFSQAASSHHPHSHSSSSHSFHANPRGKDLSGGPKVTMGFTEISRSAPHEPRKEHKGTLGGSSPDLMFIPSVASEYALDAIAHVHDYRHFPRKTFVS